MRPSFESLVARAARISDPQVTMGQLAEQWGVSAERVMDVLSALGMLDRLREDIMADPATWTGLDSTGIDECGSPFPCAHRNGDPMTNHPEVPGAH